MSKTLTHKAKLELAKARLTGGESVSAEMFLLADKLGVTGATINFHGGGDSGDFDGADLEGGEKPHVYDEEKKVWGANPKFGEDHERLSDLIKEVAEKWVESTGVDWYNNDGGGGGLHFDFKTGEVEASVYYYEQVRHEAETAEWNLLDSDETPETPEEGEE